jgi:hypothetical protein
MGCIAVASTEKDYAQGGGFAGGGDFPYDLATRLVTAMVVNSSQVQSLIGGLELEQDDVIAEGIAYAHAHWSKFDRTKSQPQTFIQQRANSGIYNYLRKEGVQDRNEQRAADQLYKRDKGVELCQWLQDVFEAAKRVYPNDPHKPGPRKFGSPRLMTLAQLMIKQGWSSRECARQLARREDLLAVLRMKSIPHWTVLNDARALGAKFLGPDLPTAEGDNGG